MACASKQLGHEERGTDAIEGLHFHFGYLARGNLDIDSLRALLVI